MRYLRHTVNKKRDYSHRHIWREHYGDIPDEMVIDHINGNIHDNRIENLQCITQKNNIQRTMRSKGYRYKGNKTKAYFSYRRFNKKEYSLGVFRTPCGAKMSYNMFFINRRNYE